MEIYRRFAIIGEILIFLLWVGLPCALAFEVEGKIKVAPPFPAPAKIPVKKDQATCGPEQISQGLLVSGDGLVQNAVVWLDGDFLKIPNEHAAEPPILNQKNCRFVPHILLVPKNQPFQVGNEDPMAHDVRIFEDATMLFRFEMDAYAKPVEKKLERAGRFVVRCGLHSWMHAFVISTEHPFYAISDETGTFRLRDVPAGHYTLHIWHEMLGETSLPIDVSKSVADISYLFSKANSS